MQVQLPVGLDMGPVMSNRFFDAVASCRWSLIVFVFMFSVFHGAERGQGAAGAPAGGAQRRPRGQTVRPVPHRRLRAAPPPPRPRAAAPAACEPPAAGSARHAFLPSGAQVCVSAVESPHCFYVRDVRSVIPLLALVFVFVSISTATWDWTVQLRRRFAASGEGGGRLRRLAGTSGTAPAALRPPLPGAPLGRRLVPRLRRRRRRRRGRRRRPRLLRRPRRLRTGSLSCPVVLFLFDISLPSSFDLVLPSFPLILLPNGFQSFVNLSLKTFYSDDWFCLAFQMVLERLQSVLVSFFFTTTDFFLSSTGSLVFDSLAELDRLLQVALEDVRVAPTALVERMPLQAICCRLPLEATDQSATESRWSVEAVDVFESLTREPQDASFFRQLTARVLVKVLVDFRWD